MNAMEVRKRNIDLLGNELYCLSAKTAEGMTLSHSERTLLLDLINYSYGNTKPLEEEDIPVHISMDLSLLTSASFAWELEYTRYCIDKNLASFPLSKLIVAILVTFCGLALSTIAFLTGSGFFNVTGFVWWFLFPLAVISGAGYSIFGIRRLIQWPILYKASKTYKAALEEGEHITKLVYKQ